MSGGVHPRLANNIRQRWTGPTLPAIQGVAEFDCVIGPRPAWRHRARPWAPPRQLCVFTDGNVHGPRTTFGNVNADVLAHHDDTFVRDDFVKTILNNDWPE